MNKVALVSGFEKLLDNLELGLDKVSKVASDAFFKVKEEYGSECLAPDSDGNYIFANKKVLAKSLMDGGIYSCTVKKDNKNFTYKCQYVEGSDSSINSPFVTIKKDGGFKTMVDAWAFADGETKWVKEGISEEVIDRIVDNIDTDIDKAINSDTKKELDGILNNIKTLDK